MDIDTPKYAGTMAAATMAAAAINTVLAKGKRGRDVTEGDSTGGGQGTSVDQRPHLHVGGDSMSFRMSKARTREKHPIKSRIQRLLNEMKLKETSIVSRYQWLSSNGFVDPTLNLHYQLNKQWPDANEGVGYNQLMPVYCFNLSSLPYATQPTFTDGTIPFYRLQKKWNALATTDAAQHNYTWKEQTGQERLTTNDIYQWTLEKTSGSDSGQRTNRHYMWNWSDIELAFKAPSVNPTRVHVCLVQFPNECAAPIRKYLSGATVTDYDTAPTDPQRVSESDLWYDSFLARKTVHPLRYVQPMDKNAPIKFLSKECICLEPGRNGEKGVFTSKIFHTANKMLRCVNPNKAEAAHFPGINTALGAQKPPVTGWNQDYNTDKQTGFPDRRKDTWLMIYAEDFNVVGKYTDPLPSNSASFDLMIRSKWTISME